MNTPGAASLCSPVQFSSTHLPGGGSKRLSGDSEEMSQSPTGLGPPKRRGRPPSKFFKQVEQRYLTQLTAQPVPPGEQAWLGRDKHGRNRSLHCGQYDSCLAPIPLFTEMCSGWWWIREPETLDIMLKALHPRGIREKALHKHLSKHKDFLQEVCLQPLTGK